jgi:hypothetical protein
MHDIPAPYAPYDEGRRDELEMNARAPHGPVSVLKALLAVACLVLLAPAAEAQMTPAAGHTPPDDTPTIKIGATIFTDYTYTQMPRRKDADGNTVNANSFNVSRAYINVTGNISHIVAFRVTPDIFRETDTASAGSGSLVYRIKYAFAQVNLDDWMPKGSWIRLGIQQTPYVDFEEGLYRYRFQGTIFAEREGYLTSSDAGVSFHAALPQNYGDIHVGLYNGDGYSKAEANDQKAVQIRGTFRPLPMHPLLRGLRVTAFYDADHYVSHAQRTRAIVNVLFEHGRANAGFEYLATKDQQSAAPVAKPDVRGRGWSIFVIPKIGSGFEAFVRYDHMRPDVDNLLEAGNGFNKRMIAGLAYWFPHRSSVSSALLFDVESVSFSGFAAPKPTEQRLALHALIAF